MRNSDYSDANSSKFSEDSSSRKDLDDSVVIQKQVQNFPRQGEQEIDLSNVNSSVFSQNKNINTNSENNQKQKRENDSDFSIITNNDKDLKKSTNKKKTQLGNKINYVITETNKKDYILYIRLDKEKSEQKKYNIYEISKNVDNKKEILCYRRYDNFNKFYEALKIRYPHYIIPKLSEKKIMAKVYDDQTFLEQRREELEFFINEIYLHEIMGKGEEINKFLSGANFDNQYFNSLLKFFDYPETLKKIKENKGIITKGMKGVSNLYNYFLGNKNNNNNERENAKKIFEKTENLTKKIQKYSSTLEEVKIIYNSFIEEYNEKKFLIDNLIFLKNEDNNENNLEKTKFNELIKINQNYNFEKSDNFLKSFKELIVNPLNFNLLYLFGEEKAIKRYKKFLEKYEEIINYQKQEKDDKRISIEQIQIKKDIEIYENNLLEDIEKIENKTNQEYESIIHALILHLKSSTENFVELFGESDLIK